MYATEEEMLGHWRNQEWKECAGDHVQEPCVARSYYGGGFDWDGMACRTCMVFISPKSPFDGDVIWREHPERLDDLTDEVICRVPDDTSCLKSMKVVAVRPCHIRTDVRKDAEYADVFWQCPNGHKYDQRCCVLSAQLISV